ncbi:helix-turn-helix domain-containing protein [Oceanisphaera avium]|uniref:Transcriptional regulator n=1 Tax=Oceanisphaera avium TaxID=1903694 RepID=A0A1Y0CXL9_9GAMM|nr:helix-turn-helix transcriptional regulator [Oceanisphaera avium]ART79764.1 transcriptional regulator [Oceanisphaera avium]
MDYLELGKIIRELRQQKKISQQQMADHLAMSRTTINAFELGRSGDVGLRKVMKMLDYLGYEVSIREKSPFPTFEELRDGH